MGTGTCSHPRDNTEPHEGSQGLQVPNPTLLPSHSVVHLGRSQHFPRTSPNRDSNICLTEELLMVCKVLQFNSSEELNSSSSSSSEKHNANIGFWCQFYP